LGSPVSHSYESISKTCHDLILTIIHAIWHISILFLEYPITGIFKAKWFPSFSCIEWLTCLFLFGVFGVSIINLYGFVIFQQFQILHLSIRIILIISNTNPSASYISQLGLEPITISALTVELLSLIWHQALWRHLSLWTK
jgi:hypothetical protein